MYINNLHGRGFSIQEFETRFTKIQQMMKENNIDAILITTEADFHYFSGLVSQFWASPTRPMYLVLPAVGKTPIAIVPTIMLESIKTTWISNIHSWPAPRIEDDGLSLLIDILSPFKNIGMSMNIESQLRMPTLHLNSLQKNLQCEFKDISYLIIKLRLVKSPAEIEKIERACQIASECFDALPERVERLNLDHLTERRVVKEMQLLLLEKGADSIPYIVGKSGNDGYDSVVDGPGDDILTPGSVFVIDTGAVFDGYHCDFDRNYVIKNKDTKNTRNYLKENKLLWEATERAIEIAKPGIRFCDLWEAMIKHLELNGHSRKDYLDGRIGHSLGLQLTELPSIIHNETTEILEGMVLTLEPWISVGKGIMVHEECIVITDIGCRMLTKRAPIKPHIIYTEVNFDQYSVNVYNPMQLQTNIPESTLQLLDEYSNLQNDVFKFHKSLDPRLTSLKEMPELANQLNIKQILVKDEGERFDLKSFKGLGSSYAINDLKEKPTVICTMTDGNHGKGVAFTAQRLGMKAMIYVPGNMTQARIDSMIELGANVTIVEGSYDDAIEMVKTEAKKNEWCMVSDTAWDGYIEIPKKIMAGYGTIFHEIEEQRTGCEPITHVLIQAGVGGLASAAMAWGKLNGNSSTWANDIELIVVEPCDADCIAYNVMKQKNVINGDLKTCIGRTDSIMTGLNCGTPSLISWPIIRDIATKYITIGDGWVKTAMKKMYNENIIAGESGAAGIAALIATKEMFSPNSVILCINSEADTDPNNFKKIIDED